MEKFTCDGIVIKTGITGESDKIVYVLTAEKGIIRAFAKGARGVKNKLHAGTALLTYGAFSFSESKTAYNITEIQIKKVFFDLRGDLDRLAMAQYFCEVMLNTVPDGRLPKEYMRLILNSINFICTGAKPLLLIKSVFELRLTCLSGYMPALIGCDVCGEYESPYMFFDCANGLLYCNKHGDAGTLPELPSAVVAAMRYIAYSDFEKVFSFELQEDLLHKLSIITGRYLEECFQQKFKTLEYLSI